MLIVDKPGSVDEDLLYILFLSSGLLKPLGHVDGKATLKYYFRMLIVFFADKPGSEYEDLLDVLFLSSGLLKPLGHSPGKPKLGTLSEGSTCFLR